MKLLTLKLATFGPFTDTNLDFAAGAGLHIIYGHNEAGKSSALRGLISFLYGFKQRTNDDFLHLSKDLRVGGILGHSDGSSLEIWRRKGTKNTLLDKAGQPIEEQVLKRFLGEADKNFFETMFGLDHIRLRQGGQDILNGKGGVYDTIIVTNPWLTELRQLASKLRDDGDKLFKPRGQNQHINSLNKICNEQRRARNEQTLRGTDWQVQDQALRQAVERLTSLNHELQTCRIEQTRLERLQRALPDIARREQLYAILAELKDTVLLSVEFSTRRIQATEQLASAKRELEVRGQELIRLDRELQDLTVNNKLLELGSEIERFSRQSGQFTKGDEDTNRLQSEIRAQIAAAYELLQEIRPELTIEQAESALHLSSIQQHSIRELGNKYSAINAKLQNAIAHQATIRAKLTVQCQTLAKLSLAANTSELKWACEQAQRAGNIEERLAEVRAALVKEHASVDIGLRKLWGWNQDLETLERLTLPTQETVEVFRDGFTELEGRHNLLAGQLEASQAKLNEATHQLATMQGEGGVPDEDTLNRARKRRDFGWHLVRNAWLTGQRNAAAERSFNAEQALPEAYEHSVLTADEIGDRLRRETARVQRQAQVRADVARYQKELEGLQQGLTAVAHKRTERDCAWQSLWQPLGIDCRSPKEMRAWLDQAERLCRQAERLRDSKIEETALHTRREELLTELGVRLEDLAALATPGERLETRLSRALAVVQHHDELRIRRRELETTVTELEHQAQDIEQVTTITLQDLEAWRGRWGNAVTILGLDAEASPSQANLALERISKLFEALKDAAGKRERIQGIQRDSEEFGQAIENLCAKVAPDLHGQPPLAVVGILHTRLQEARSIITRREALSQQRETNNQQLAQARLRQQRARDQLDACLREAQCEHAEMLPEIERLSATRRERERDLDACRNRLLELSSGKGEAALIAEATRSNADALPSQIQALEVDILRLDNERSELNQAIGNKQALLNQLDGRSNAADHTEALEQSLAALRTYGERYLRFRFASAVLEQQIKVIVDGSETPLLGHASGIFSRLTAGAFTGLETWFDDNDTRVLRGRRAHGVAVLIEGMSAGTLDQLFLALRLASIEIYLEHAEPIPLIVDDILIHYDDTRSIAALQELSRLSERTQVIMFSHHQHLLELAQKSLQPGGVWITKLS